MKLIQKIWAWVKQDMAPPAPEVISHLGLDSKGHPIFKPRTVLKPYDHKKLHEPEQMERMLDHVEDRVEELLSAMIGSGGKR